MVPYKSQHRHVQRFVEGKIYKLNKPQQKNELECTDFEIQIHFHVQHVKKTRIRSIRRPLYSVRFKAQWIKSGTGYDCISFQRMYE